MRPYILAPILTVLGVAAAAVGLVLGAVGEKDGALVNWVAAAALLSLAMSAR